MGIEDPGFFYESRDYQTGILTEETIEAAVKKYTGERVAIIDLDGTAAESLLPFCIALCEGLAEEGLEIDFRPSNNIAFNIIASLENKYPKLRDQFDPTKVYKPFNEPNTYEKAGLIEETAEMIMILKKLGYQIIYATSRPENTIETTKQWIAKYKLPIDELLFENHEAKKSELVVTLAPVVAPGSIFYDDKAQTLQESMDALRGLREQGFITNIDIFGHPTTWNGGINPERCEDPHQYGIEHLLKYPKEVLQTLGIYGLLGEIEI